VLLLLFYHWKNFKSFRQSVRKIDLVRNWAVVGELMSLPVAIIITMSSITRFFFQSLDS